MNCFLFLSNKSMDNTAVWENRGGVFILRKGGVSVKYAVDRKEMRRYMGVRGDATDDALERLMSEATDAIQRMAQPRYVYRESTCSCRNGGVYFAYHQHVDSRALHRYLSDCSRVIVFAATLGSEVDRAIAKDSLLHPALAVAEQAAAASLLESYCNACCEEMETSFLSQGFRFKPRFSPGYADCPLQSQTELLRFLNAYKHIGLALTESHMMTPMKSVSAWIGVTDRMKNCEAFGCDACDKFDCEFRNGGITVG